AFTLAEAVELLTGPGPALPAGHVASLYARAEGWPAGLRLAGLAARRGEAGAASGGAPGGDAIAEYLTREVLAGQPAEIHDALCCTSVVERMSGDLFDALTGRADGERLLADLAGDNLFVVPVGTRAGTYRYHGMFRDLLRQELRRRAPGRLVDLHRRAARWHRERGFPVDALRHALAAGDWRDATEVLAGHWPSLVVTHREAAPEPPPPPPPPDAVRADPLLALAYAAERLDRGDLDGVRRHLRLATRQGGATGDIRRDRFAAIAAAL